MDKYNITVTDPTFYTAFAEFCEENKGACIEFLQGKMEFIPSNVDRTPKFDDLLTTRRVFLQSQLRQEFESEFPYEESSNLNNRAELMDNFVRNKITMLAETQTIEQITLYKFDKNKKSALTDPSSLNFDNITPIATSKNFDGLKLDESSLALKDKPSSQLTSIDPSILQFDNTTISIDKNLNLPDIPLEQIDLGFKEKPSSVPTSIDPASFNFDNTTPIATSKNFDGLKLDESSLALKDKPSPQPVNVDSNMNYNNNVEIENKSLLENIKSSISKFLNKQPDALDLKNNNKNKPK